VKRVLLDTNVILYAIGGPHPYAEPCRRIVSLAGEGRLELEAPVDLVQEILHHRTRRLGDRRQAAAEALAAGTLCRLHAVEPQDAIAATELFADSPRLSARDAVFAAVAVRHGLDTILSADSDFDSLPGLRRLDPAAPSAVTELLGPLQAGSRTEIVEEDLYD
jgi:predicted nucleic acid-binding protein